MSYKQSFSEAFLSSSIQNLPRNHHFLKTPLINSSYLPLVHGSVAVSPAPDILGTSVAEGMRQMTRSDSVTTSITYDEQISSMGNAGAGFVDYKTVTKHLGKPQETLKMQGGDVARHMYHQLENAAKLSQDGRDLRRARLLSFSDYLLALRRESTASDINVPGGFRREFLINKSVQQNRAPPNFLTRNFMEFLTIYGHFAGEDFDDDESDEDSELTYEDVFDEESQLLHERRRQGGRLSRKKAEPPKGTASELKTFFLLFKALVGSGVLFLPRAFCNGGLLFSTLTLSGFGVLTYLCYIVLIHSKSIFNKSSFGELGYLTYGKPLKYSIMVSIIISQIGFVATYILFTAENMNAFMKQVFDVTVAKGYIVFIQCCLLIPLVLIRDLTKLSFTSFISSVFILLGLVIIFYYAGIQLYTEGVGPNIEQFNASTWPMLIGVAVTAFEGIGLILPIQASMERPENFPRVLLVSMVVITTLFVLIGVVGYSAFGENVRSIIILNLDQSNMAVQLILVLYSVAVFLTGPLQLFPAIRIGESVIFNSSLFVKKSERNNTEEGRLYQTSGKYNPHIKWMKNFFRAVFVVVISLLAYLNSNNIDKFVSLNGCFACIPLVYIYPPLIHLKTYERKPDQSKILHGLDYMMIVVGVMAVVYTTFQILFQVD
ncbi:hypothetical protein PUMCH_003491 [Australozyma saopauloensis]|uniref:Amino acid transporter transmembrane domain-containing protein n=1 Tax=Australozyma saopauloensis TaxID=291208 RepID=A0AAX4HC43_9ASCO|nr:hypothetical protein PUMCH_003491 [[Candida] saopauloensis]